MSDKKKTEAEPQAPAAAPCVTHTPRPDVSTVDGAPAMPAKEKA